MNQTESLAKIQSYGNAHAELVNALERFPRAMWQYRPADGASTNRYGQRMRHAPVEF